MKKKIEEMKKKWKKMEEEEMETGNGELNK